MPKPTKNIITRESITKDLRLLKRAELRTLTTLFLGVSIVFLPLATLFARWFHSEELLLYPAVQTLFAVFIWCVFASPALVVLFPFLRRLSEQRLLKNGCFEVVVRPLSYKQELLVHRHIKECFVFRELLPVTVDHTNYQLASSGDEFYIVHISGRKHVELFYPLSMYDYKETGACEKRDNNA